jgi:hypothetical protein
MTCKGNPPQSPGTRVPGGGVGGSAPDVGHRPGHCAERQADFRRRECLDGRGAVQFAKVAPHFLHEAIPELQIAVATAVARQFYIESGRFRRIGKSQMLSQSTLATLPRAVFWIGTAGQVPPQRDRG